MGYHLSEGDLYTMVTVREKSHRVQRLPDLRHQIVDQERKGGRGNLHRACLESVLSTSLDRVCMQGKEMERSSGG